MEGQGQPDFLERSWHLVCFQNVPWLHKPKEVGGARYVFGMVPFLLHSQGLHPESCFLIIWNGELFF